MPWRRLKAVVPILIVAAIVLYLQSNFFAFKWQQKTNVERRSDVQFKEGRLHHFANLGLPWLQKEKSQQTPVVDDVRCHCSDSYKPSADIYTYNLPDVTNYTLDKDREYHLPDPRKDIMKRETSADFDGEPIQVILVPFSHADPGYGNTMEGYYSSKTKGTLDNMVQKLQQYRNMTFQWVETVFLERWFRDISQTTKTAVRDLINRGQLEIVLGGWVMPDEASTHYGAVIDQLIEGHQWLEENLGVKPITAWINDPFGYSSTLPYIWQRAGLENLVILRIHQAIKSTLMKKQELEFQWRPFWKQTGSRDILCNIMPYRNYWLNNVCGRDQTICGQFNYLHVGGHNSKAKVVTEQNVASLAETMYKEYKYTAGFYRYKTLYIGMGEDFSYPDPQAWDNTYKNYQQLINYINAKKEWNMNVKFGTLTEYFKRVKEMEAKYGKQLDSTFPVLSGDFFPYSDWDNAYWTGYYTTRPAIKRFGREIEPLVRAAEIMNVYVTQFSKAKGINYDVGKMIVRKLRHARREIGMFLHHDGITGTSLSFVVQDFKSRLEQAFESAISAMKMILASLLSDSAKIEYGFEKKLTTDILKLKTLKMSDNELKVVAINPTERERVEIVSVEIDSTAIGVKCPDGDILPIQVSNGGYPNSPTNMASFQAKVPPFGVRTYTISKPGTSQTYEYKHASIEDAKPIILDTKAVKVEFDSSSGMIQRILDKTGHTTSVSALFMYYRSGKSGAYLFNAASEAVPLKLNSPTVKVLHGPMWSEVCLDSVGLLHCARVYNASGVQGRGVFFRNEISLVKLGLSNSEVILRLTTDVRNDNIFFTDQNGYQLLGRKTYPDRLTESNFYPITNMAFLEDDTKRLTVHTAQPHGVASLKEGWLEIMLDRTMTRDDGRGLGTGVLDRDPSLSEFIIQIENRIVKSPTKEFRFAKTSNEASLISEFLKNPIQIYAYTDILAQSDLTLSPIVNPLPCDISTVGLRHLVNNNYDYSGTSLVLHRKSFDCNFETSALADMCPVSSKGITIGTLFKDFHSSFKETTLSHLYDIQKLNVDSDITPECNELRSFLVDVP